MLRSRIILIAVSLALIALLFTLPKIVVDNENEKVDDTTSNTVSGGSEKVDKQKIEQHLELSNEIVETINSLRNKLEASENQTNSVIFADSLAAIFKKNSKFDSAAKYLEIASQSEEIKGDAFYEAFTFAIDAEKANFFGKKTREYFEKILAEDASRLDIKTKIAMTYVSTENPMKGILMLREVIEQDPDNEEALFNLGVLSIQSGQHKKAIERFDRLLSKNAGNEQARFYLALSYFNDGQKQKAKSLFEEIKNSSSDEQLLAAVNSYLNEF